MPETARVLIVDDEPSMREFLSILMRKMSLPSEVAEHGEAAIALLDEQRFDIVITDLKMTGAATGLDVLRHAKESAPGTQVIVMTAFATPETAIEALKIGAYDYLTKPFKVDQVRAVLRRALEKSTLLNENLLLRRKLQEQRGYGDIIGTSKPMREVFELIDRVAPTRTTVLVHGESGTGKELVAGALHERSALEGAFIAVNCGAIPETLIDSELFGYVKGAFTGADRDQDGLFQAADGGTLFLDEVGELPAATQVRLLRVLQERSVKPVGGTRERPINVRIVAATNRDLHEEVEAGRFREDLYYRLNVIAIELPPLRDRGNDIRLLVEHFVRNYAEQLGTGVRGVDADALAALLNYRYPGNIRELQNIIERAVTLERTDFVTLDSLPRHVVTPGHRDVRGLLELSEDGADLDAILAEVERGLLEQALVRTNGNRTEAAKLLNISFRSIRYRLSKFGLAEDD